MWAYGRHLRIASIDSHRVTMDSCIVAEFEQECQSSMSDVNPMLAKIGYVGVLEKILEVGYRTFKQILLKVKWYQTHYRGLGTTYRLDESGFYAIDSTKYVSSRIEPYVFPVHCEQAFFFSDPCHEGWKYVIHVHPRSVRIFQERDEEVVTSIQIGDGILDADITGDAGDSHEAIFESDEGIQCKMMDKTS